MTKKEVTESIAKMKFGGVINTDIFEMVIFTPAITVTESVTNHTIRENLKALEAFQKSGEKLFQFKAATYMQAPLKEEEHIIPETGEKYFTGAALVTSPVKYIYRYTGDAGKSVFFIVTGGSYYIADTLYPSRRVVERRKKLADRLPEIFRSFVTAEA